MPAATNSRRRDAASPSAASNGKSIPSLAKAHSVPESFPSSHSRSNGSSHSSSTHSSSSSHGHSSGPSRPTGLSKYRDWQGPFFTMLFIFFFVVFAVYQITEIFFPGINEAHYDLAHPPPYYAATAWILFLYTVFMVTIRFLECGSYVFYESVWCCNLGMMLTATGIWLNKPILISAAFAGVSMDQLMWYVDCTSWVFTRKFPVGAAKYLAWPNTSWTKKVTCFHHLLFLPVCLYLTRLEIPAGTFLLGSLFTTISTTLCRFLTPFEIVDPSDAAIVHYLNINCGYKFWRDVKIKFLHLMDDQPWFIWLPAFAVWGNGLLNGPSYLFFVQLCAVIKPTLYGH